MILVKRSKTWSDSPSASHDIPTGPPEDEKPVSTETFMDDVTVQTTVSLPSYLVCEHERISYYPHLKLVLFSLQRRRPFFATRRFIFPFGIFRVSRMHVFFCLVYSSYGSIPGSVGVFIGLILIQPSDIQGMHAHLSLLLEEYDITIPSIPDFDFSRVEEEWRKLRGNIPELWNFNRDRRDFQVGESMKDRGLSAQHPIILIPGVVSTVRAADWLDLFFSFQ